MDELKRSALAYAGMGLRVFPLHTITPGGGCSCGKPGCSSPGKHPRTSGGCKDATTERATIGKWWERWPDANIGIATGKGLCVIDIDAKDFGEDYFPQLEERYGALPDSWEVITGGGGRHIYLYSGETGIRNQVGWVTGVDVRGEGGYVVAPPSIHASGAQYEWEVLHRPTNPIAALPDAWKAAMAGNETRKQPPSPASEPIAEGNRNNLMFRLASSLRAKGLSESALLAALREENQQRCQPPLEDDELRRLVSSAGKYQQGPVTGSARQTVPEGYELSDIGLANLYAGMHGETLRWVQPWGWTVWTGQKWEAEAAAEAVRRAMDTANTIYRAAVDKLGEAARADDPEAAQAAAEKKVKAAWSIRRKNRLDAMTSLASAYMVDSADIFDNNPGLLNTPGGMLELQTGKLLPHDKAARCTMITSVSPCSMPTPVFDGFLDTVTNGSRGLQDYLRQVAGMALWGKVYTEGMVICYGTGSNGKSTFLNLLEKVLGDYAISINPELLLAQKAGQQVQGMAELRGKRLAVAQETEEGRRLSVSVVKQLTSTNQISAKRLYRDPETFEPSHTLLMDTNFLPKVGSLDEGTWRRLFVVPFTHKIPDSEKITGFGERLFQEAPGVLQWMADGAKQFYLNGYKLLPPLEVQAASKRYRESENWLNQFIEECCLTGNDYNMAGGYLYEAYKIWSKREGQYCRRSRDFAAALMDAGYDAKRAPTARKWYGIKLSDDMVRLVVNSGYDG